MLYLKYTVFVGIRRNSPGRPVGSTPSEIVGLGGNSFSNYLEGGLGTVMRRLSVRKVSLTALVFVLVLSLSAVASAESFTLTILHTNDVHGRIFSYDHRELGENAGGYARRATLIEQVKAENPYTLVLDAGDLFSGTPVSAVYKGQPDMIAAMLVGYDAITIGNHEFDYGQDVLKDADSDSRRQRRLRRRHAFCAKPRRFRSQWGAGARRRSCDNVDAGDDASEKRRRLEVPRSGGDDAADYGGAGRRV